MRNNLLDQSNHHLLKAIFFALLLCSISLPITYFIARNRPLYGAIVIVGLIGIAIALVSLFKPKLGFVFLFLFSSFMFIIARIAGREDLMLGVANDALVGIVFVGIILQRIMNKHPRWINFSPIVLTYVIFTIYLFIQFFNPDGSINAWSMGMRRYISSIIVYIILMHLLVDMKSITNFTKLWLLIFLLAAFYACYQEWFGLPAYDLKWVTRTPMRIGLNWTFGRWDKWSFVSDIAAFGLMMSFATVFCLILSTGPFTKKQKLFFLASAFCMFIGMLYSGNRTAFASFPFGLMLYGLLSLNNPKTLLISIVLGISLIIVIFGPFYAGEYIKRLRSAFDTEDTTMQLRDRNRAFVRPYIFSHPMGGGYMTTGDQGNRYAPNHDLAGFPPDSLYLQTVLELGWIGLLIQLTFYFVVTLTGVQNYYIAGSRKAKILYLAYTCGFFSLTIAAFAKKALNSIPLGIVLMGLYVILDRMKDYDNNET